jgi:hypothetical protein
MTSKVEQVGATEYAFVEGKEDEVAARSDSSDGVAGLRPDLCAARNRGKSECANNGHCHVQRYAAGVAARRGLAPKRTKICHYERLLIMVMDSSGMRFALQ